MQSSFQESQTSGNEWRPAPRAMAYQWAQETHATDELTVQTYIFQDLEAQMVSFEGEHLESLEDLRKYYVFPPGDSVTSFLASYRAIPRVLKSAVSHLKSAFGSETVFILRVPPDELGAQSLFAVALWPGAASDAHAALKGFDDDWWIANSHQASGYLNFTYELV